MQMMGLRNGAMSGLPYDAEVEYLEANGTQFIDTGVKASGRHSVDCIFQMVSFVSSARVFGGMGPNTGYDGYSFGCGSDRTIAIQHFGINDALSGRPTLNTGINHVIMTSDRVDVVDVGYKDLPRTFVSVEYNVYIFGMTRGSNVLSAPFFGRVFDFLLEDDNGVIIDFIPVKFTNENGNSEGAMYNRLGVGGMNPDGSLRNDGLFRNRGTGAFGWKELDGTIVQPQ